MSFVWRFPESAVTNNNALSVKKEKKKLVCELQMHCPSLKAEARKRSSRKDERRQALKYCELVPPRLHSCVNVSFKSVLNVRSRGFLSQNNLFCGFSLQWRTEPPNLKGQSPLRYVQKGALRTAKRRQLLLVLSAFWRSKILRIPP